MKTIVYYVSGHGYGHARRSAAIMRAIVARRADVEILARTSTPAGIYAGIPRVRVQPPAEALDFAVVEIDAMSIDVGATLAGAAALMDRGPEIVARETAYLRGLSPAMVVADIPFIVGEVVRTYRSTGAMLPAVAVGNFTWDWIYAPYFAGHPEYAAMAPAMRDAYSQFDVCLRLPMAHQMDCFSYVMDVPLVVTEPVRPATETVARLGLAGDARPRVLMAMRGGLSETVMRAAAEGSPHCLFLTLDAVAAGMPENLREIPAGIDFTDLMAACQVAVTKLGYGILADAIACGTRLVWPARRNFREDEVFRMVLPDYVREAEISREDLRAGNWRGAINAALAAGQPPKRMGMDGAGVCADEILCRMLA